MVNFETPGPIVSLQCLNPEIRMNTIMQLGIPQKCDKSVDFLGGGGGENKYLFHFVCPEG